MRESNPAAKPFQCQNVAWGHQQQQHMNSRYAVAPTPEMYASSVTSALHLQDCENVRGHTGEEEMRQCAPALPFAHSDQERRHAMCAAPVRDGHAHYHYTPVIPPPSQTHRMLFCLVCFATVGLSVCFAGSMWVHTLQREETHVATSYDGSIIGGVRSEYPRNILNTLHTAKSDSIELAAVSAATDTAVDSAAAAVTHDCVSLLQSVHEQTEGVANNRHDERQKLLLTSVVRCLAALVQKVSVLTEPTSTAPIASTAVPSTSVPSTAERPVQDTKVKFETAV